MVFVNSEKFACESCIKGHRSSSCHHTDRPLFEIKRKGRPVSQCETCRELRQSRRMHSKCTCRHNRDAAVQQMRALSPSKPLRYIPIVPALPNGLKDLQAAKASKMAPADSRQRVNTLLNPCNCKSIWKCKCRAPKAVSGSPEADNSLVTLARAASMIGGGESSSSPSHLPGPSKPKRNSRPGTPNNPSGKRHKYNGVIASGPPSGPDLPPILFSTSSEKVPVFPAMPPMTTLSSLAGSGCTCGLQCACPGCIQHRGPEHAFKERRDCADGCGSCIDHAGGIELPSASNGNITSGRLSILDQFFARAAALPRPPSNRKMGVDPVNVIVYPTVALETERHGMAFGLVSLPKLDCCGGVCGCPNGTCGCGKACDGCCAEHASERERKARNSAPSASACDGEGSISSVLVAEPESLAPVARSCCAK